VKKLTRTTTLMVVTVLSVLCSLMIRPAPSFANSQWGCNYPYVCIYSGGFSDPIVGRFKDVTPGWQYFPQPRTGEWTIVNTRNDDVVYYLYRWSWENFDRVDCIMPNQNIGAIATLRAIRIDSANYCSVLGHA
jgi:hypothetical protein